MIKLLIKNPLSIWLKRSLTNFYIQLINRSNDLRIGYMCIVSQTKFGKFNTLYDNVVLNNVDLGDFTYIAGGTRINNTVLGKFCSIGPDVLMGLGKHPTNSFVSTHPLFFSTLGQAQKVICDRNYFDEFGSILIGHDVWIGARSIVLDGVSIGNGAIVAAGALVTKDVPPYAIVGGVPAKIIKYRFDCEDIEFLLSYEWWNKDLNWLITNFKLLHDLNSLLNSSNKPD